MSFTPKASALGGRWKGRDSDLTRTCGREKAGWTATRVVASQRTQTSPKSRFSVSYLIASIWELIVCCLFNGLIKKKKCQFTCYYIAKSFQHRLVINHDIRMWHRM